LAVQSDLLLVGGHVIDPSQGIHRVMDIAVSGGKIKEVGFNLDRRDASEVLDVSGKYVCPGLIDLHGHWYEGSVYGIDPHHCLNTGVTTAIDAGTTGFVNFPEFRRNCIDKANVRLLAFVNIACIGLPTALIGELEDLRYARPEETASILERHREVTLGVKIREFSRTAGDGIEALNLAIRAAEAARMPLMVHIGPGAKTPEILRRLRPGDILTHCYQGRGDGLITEPGGQLLCEARQAKERGIIFDIGHGSGSFKWETAQKAFEHSFYPDTISTDLHRYSVDGPVYDMPTTLSKFLCLGMSLEEVILKSTWTPAKSIGREAEIGTLQAGAAADVFVFELATGEFQYFDTHFRSRRGDKRLVPSLTMMGGKVIVPGAYEVNPRPLEPWDAEIAKLLEETA
jgi:dihydroorotase